MKMPWGKHKGVDIEDLDDGYLQWIAENITGNDAVVREAENQLTMRKGRGVARSGNGRTQYTDD